jgi:flagellar hook-associated protein 2
LGIAFGSINTGLPKDIVKQIMAAEQVPIQNMEKQKSKIQDKKGLVEQLLKLMEDVRGNLMLNGSARSLREMRVETNNDIISANVDKNVAVPGTYQLEVLQLAQKSSAMSTGFADKDTSYVGVGFIQYTLPNGDTKEVYVDSDNSSLAAISKLINKDTSLGVTANVVNDGTGTDKPWRLVLSLNQTGDDAAAEFPYFYFVDGEDDFQLDFQREAHNAKIKLDGFEIEAPEDKLKDMIPGVTIDLKKAKPGEEFALKISEDTEAVSAKVGDLVNKLNSVLKFIKEQNTMDEKTDTSRTLGGDSMLQSLQGRIHGAVFSDVETDFGLHRVSELGLGFNREGMVEFDPKRFKVILDKQYNLVAQSLTDAFTEDHGKTKGCIDHLNEMATTTLRNPDGLIQSRKNTLQANIAQIDKRVSEKQKSLEEKEKHLKDKFARLEGTMSKIRAQGAGVGAIGGNGSSVQELG